MNIDVRYLDVKWADRYTILKVDYAEDSLVIEQRKDYSQVESTTFKNYLPRLGFRILDKDILHTPCFIISDTKTKELLPVVDPTTHETWWVESSGWDNRNRLHHSEIFRTVGSVTVRIQNRTLKIVNNSLGFTVDELEVYLRDFKNDLWMLILNQQGYIKGSIDKELPSIFHPEMVKHLHDYSDAIERIIRKPTNELIEIQVERPIRSVKPVNRTFMELAVKGSPKYLTSRANKESYDTPDNRYIHYTLKRVLYLINQLAVLGDSQDSIYERIISTELERLDSLSDSKHVDSVVFCNEIKSIDKTMKEIVRSVNTALNDGGSVTSANEFTYRLRLTKKYGSEHSKRYFCDYLDGYLFREKHGTYLIVTLPDFMPMDCIISPARDIEVLIKGTIRKGKDYNNSGNVYYYIKFLTISNITIEDHPLYRELERLEKAKTSLEKVNWVVPYTNKERQDVESERKFIRKKVELLNSRQEGVKNFNNSIISIVRILRNSKVFFEKASVRISENFPNTMVFVQNPSYSLLKASFSKISSINGMDDSIFSAMMSILKLADRTNRKHL